jgi:cytochrome c556
MNADQAADLLKRCGTSPDYKGLWRDVAAFRNPPAATKLPELMEIATVESMPAAMAKLDRHFDLLKLAADAGWKTPPDHPDLVPVTEALLVQEGLTESLRLLTKDQPEALQSLMRKSAGQAEELTNAIRSGDIDQAAKLLSQLTANCKACHQQFRN